MISWNCKMNRKIEILFICSFFLILSATEGLEQDVLTCECGWRNKQRIVGGKETRKNEYPWMVAIAEKKNLAQFCGGSIITPWHILTAAHCTDGKQAEDIVVMAGCHNITNLREPTSEHIPIKQIIQHQNYDAEEIIYDIAIMVSSRAIHFNKAVGPVCLPNKRVDLERQKVKVTGWGLTKDRGEPSPVLHAVNLKVVSLSRCKKDWNGMIETDPPTQLCTYRENKDSCNQDSGGPLVWLDPEMNKHFQVALVSYGGACGEKRAAVNTDVFAYMDWIQDQVATTKPGAHVCTKQLVHY